MNQDVVADATRHLQEDARLARRLAALIEQSSDLGRAHGPEEAIRIIIHGVGRDT